MTENEFLLADRVAKIQAVVGQYGEDTFSISFSGGKDSTVLSWLVDYALPGNTIPRVFADTGIELSMVRDFVKSCAAKDSRVVMIKPSVPVKKMLEEKGYPFKSKEHAKYVDIYQRHSDCATSRRYLSVDVRGPESSRFLCPKILRYQFTPEFKLRVSSKCCDEMKKKPLRKWQKENSRPNTMIGIMTAEGGARQNAHCITSVGKGIHFQPLTVVTKAWEDWLIETYGIEICDIYKPPYNFERTGCKGCPFNIKIQEELDTLKEYFPGEYQACENLWKPVYDEYRRIGYRLRPKDEMEQMRMDDRP